MQNMTHAMAIMASTSIMTLAGVYLYLCAMPGHRFGWEEPPEEDFKTIEELDAKLDMVVKSQIPKTPEDECKILEFTLDLCFLQCSSGCEAHTVAVKIGILKDQIALFAAPFEPREA
jgi:hypothetical protein